MGRQGAQGRLVPNSFPALLQDPLLPQTPAGAAPRAAWLSAGTGVVYCLPPPDRLLGGVQQQKGGHELQIQLQNATRPTHRAMGERRYRQNNGTDPTGQTHSTHSCPPRRRRHIPPHPLPQFPFGSPPDLGAGRPPHWAPAPGGCWRPQDRPVQQPQNPLSGQSPHPQALPTPSSPPRWPRNPINTPKSLASTWG